jgi:sulfatase maturation enzyme AslB (radical SAM superfamily)
LAIRTTITRYNVHLQSEMVERFLDCFAVTGLFFQPVYPGTNRDLPSGLVPDPADFVRHFVPARRRARERGINLVTAASRVEEVHGRFCPVLQHNLLLLPEGQIATCFLDNSGQAFPDSRFGGYDPRSGKLVLHEDRLALLLERLVTPRPECWSCFNSRHCSLGCPEYCPLKKTTLPPDCRVPRWIAFATLLEAAGIDINDKDLAHLEQDFPAPPLWEEGP